MYEAKQYEMFEYLDDVNSSSKEISEQEAFNFVDEHIGLNVQCIFDALHKADENFSLKTSLNPANGLARWGDINEFIALQVMKKGVVYHREKGQPTFFIEDKNVQIIVMSGNKALGNYDLPISANCVKGSQTQEKIEINRSSYNNRTELQTWILYYPSRNHEVYQEDNPTLMFELARPTSFQKIRDGEIFPTDHDCRLIFSEDGEMPSYINEDADDAVSEDSFDIGYKNGTDE